MSYTREDRDATAPRAVRSADCGADHHAFGCGLAFHLGVADGSEAGPFECPDRPGVADLRPGDAPHHGVLGEHDRPDEGVDHPGSEPPSDGGRLADEEIDSGGALGRLADRLSAYSRSSTSRYHWIIPTGAPSASITK